MRGRLAGCFAVGPLSTLTRGFAGGCRRGLGRATRGAGGYAVRSNFRGVKEAGGWSPRRTETEGRE